MRTLARNALMYHYVYQCFSEHWEVLKPKDSIVRNELNNHINHFLATDLFLYSLST